MGIKSLLGFLTIIPVRMDKHSFEEAAELMHLFPLLGAFIGFLAGMFAFLIFKLLPNLVVGILTLGFLLLITGLHHTDGLLDFGDGLMAQGSPQKKIKVMHDKQTGTGGVALGLITFLTTALAIGGLTRIIILQSLVTAEVSAKLAMVVAAWAGKSAHKGMNTYFINIMHDRYRSLRMIAALIISFGIAMPLLPFIGVIGIVASILTGLIMVWISNRHFRGMTGDVFGATNDLARMTTLIAILAAIKWL